VKAARGDTSHKNSNVTGIPVIYRVFKKSHNFGCSLTPRIGGGLGGIGRDILSNRLDSIGGRPKYNTNHRNDDNDRHCLTNYDDTNFDWFSGKGDIRYIDIVNGRYNTIDFHPGRSFDLSRGFHFFTAEMHLCFIYKGNDGESLSITTDGDLWLYIDGNLFMDLGGIHSTITLTKSLIELNLTVGHVYRMDIFLAQRHRIGDNISINFDLCTGCCAVDEEENKYREKHSDEDDRNTQITSRCGSGSPPTKSPTSVPTKSPTTKAPPTKSPTSVTSSPPTKSPTVVTSSPPTKSPSYHTKTPTTTATSAPTKSFPPHPSKSPSSSPTTSPTKSPSYHTPQPTDESTTQPTTITTNQPTNTPTQSTTVQPTQYTNEPTIEPSQPTLLTISPTQQPTTLTYQPTHQPTNEPTSQPTMNPSNQPTIQPTIEPTTQPTFPTNQPTIFIPPISISPILAPSIMIPTLSPTEGVPTLAPSVSSGPTHPPPTTTPSSNPTESPSTIIPTSVPTTNTPSIAPTNTPTINTNAPTTVIIIPTSSPTIAPTCAPTPSPTTPPPPVYCCGNGIVEPGEECDNGENNNDIYGNCTHHCRLPRCGDGIIHRCNTSGNCQNCASCDAMEECDDGNNINGDGCSANCRFEYSSSIANIVSTTATTYKTNNLIRHLPDCPTLICVTPPKKDLEQHIHDMDFTLLYWIKNYCYCQSSMSS
jgi:fibro-slime domain-containing protein